MTEKSRSPQLNSIIRALKLLEILKLGTDRDNKLTQEQLLKAMKKMDGSCTLKTMRTDLRNLMAAINPVMDEDGDEYREHPEKFRIIYDGIEEGRHRMSGIQYIHDFTNDELNFMIELVKGNGGISNEQVELLTGKIKDLGSRFYKYTSDSITAIPEHTTFDTTYLRHNLWVINMAIINNLKVSFVFNGYNRDGVLEPVREKKYEVNPYYVVSYQHKYYMLCTHAKYEDVHIYRLDLMTDAELMEEPRESVRNIPELEHSNANEYMDKHLNMFYDEPRTIRLKVKNGPRGYTAIHDHFGKKYIFKNKIDDEYDEIEIMASGDAVIEFAIKYMDIVEIIRPQALRKRVAEKAAELIKRYER